MSSMKDSFISRMLIDGNFLTFCHSGVYLGSDRKILPQKENRLSAET